jgi:hypothetical protein
MYHQTFSSSFRNDSSSYIPKRVNVFERGITLPGRSELSLAATTSCRLQLSQQIIMLTTIPLASYHKPQTNLVCKYVPHLIPSGTFPPCRHNASLFAQRPCHTRQQTSRSNTRRGLLHSRSYYSSNHRL